MSRNHLHLMEFQDDSKYLRICFQKKIDCSKYPVQIQVQLEVVASSISNLTISTSNHAKA